jgi:hypothetical protein
MSTAKPNFLSKKTVDENVTNLLLVGRETLEEDSSPFPKGGNLRMFSQTCAEFRLEVSSSYLASWCLLGITQVLE